MLEVTRSSEIHGGSKQLGECAAERKSFWYPARANVTYDCGE